MTGECDLDVHCASTLGNALLDAQQGGCKRKVLEQAGDA